MSLRLIRSVCFALALIATAQQLHAQFPENTRPVDDSEQAKDISDYFFDIPKADPLDELELKLMYDRAYALYDDKDFQRAHDGFSKILERAPDETKALKDRGITRVHLHRYAEAVRDLDKYLLVKPHDAAAWDWMATAQEFSGDLNGAIASYTAQLKLAPKEHYVHYRRGNVYQKLGLAKPAIDDYSKAIAAEPANPSYWLNRGIVKLYGTEDMDAARADFDKVLELDHTLGKHSAYLYRGLSYSRQDRHDEANEDYDEYYELESNDADFAEMISEDLNLAYAQKTPPTTSQDHFERGKLVAQTHHRAAVFDFQRTVEIAPKHADAYYWLATSLRTMGYYQSAVDTLHKCIEVDDRYYLAYHELGEVLRVELERPADSIPHHLKVVELRPDSPQAHIALGIAQRANGDPQAAVTALNKALELAPGDAFAYMHRAYARALAGDHDNAIIDANKAVELKPQDPFAYHHRGLVKREQGDLNGAIVEFDAALKLQSLTVVLLDRGLTYLQLGKTDLAQSDFDAALKFKPDIKAKMDAEIAKIKAKSDPAQLPENTQPTEPAAAPANVFDPHLDQSTPPVDEEKLADALERAVSLYEAKDFRGAYKAFDEVYRLSPDYHEALYRRGVSLAKLEQYEPAIRDLDRYLQIKTDDLEAWNWKGIAEELSGDLNAAVASYTKVLELNPQDATAYQYRGDVYRKLGLAQPAIADYSRALEADNNNVHCWMYRGVVKVLGTENPVDALADLNKAIELDSSYQDHAAYLYRGLAYARQEKDDESWKDHDEFVRLNPDDKEYAGDIVEGLGIGYDLYADAKTAEEFYDRGNGLADFDHSAAVFAFQRAVELGTEDAKYRNALAMSLAIKKQFQAAADMLKLCLEDDERDFDALYELAEILRIDLVRPKESIQYYQRALELEPENADMHLGLGKALIEVGDFAAAIKSLTKSLEVKPDNPNALMHRGHAYAKLGDFKHALADANQAVKLAPEDPIAYRFRGLVKQEQKDFDGAIADFDAGLKLRDLAYVHLDRGLIHLRVGRTDMAQADFDAAEKLYPQIWFEMDAEIAKVKALSDPP